MAETNWIGVDVTVRKKGESQPINPPGELKVYYSDELRQEAIRKYGPPTEPLNKYTTRFQSTQPKEEKTRCPVDGCGDRTIYRGMCDKHYRKWLKERKNGEQV